MIEAVDAAGFQFKNGAAFIRGDDYGDFDFGDKFTPGRDSTYQVQRAAFDKLLADEAEKQGVEIRYETRVVAVDTPATAPRVTRETTHGIANTRRKAASSSMRAALRGRCRGCSISRSPSSFPVRNAVFTHVADQRSATAPSIATRSRSSFIRGIATCGTGSFPSRTAAARSAALRARNSSTPILPRSMSV